MLTIFTTLSGNRVKGKFQL